MSRKSYLRPALMGAGLALLLPTAASAHFVWVEPAPATAGSVQVCFGEYPELREGAPLLDRVQRVQVYAANSSGRRELKPARAENAFVYSGVGDAPVVFGRLDYGILQRENTPPYMLRYEALLLRGARQPLPLAEVARLSRTETGLPLVATFAPAGTDRLALTVRLDGKPVQAEVAHLTPGSAEMKKEKTDAAGRLEFPAASGWHHLRISAEDGKPATFEGKEGKFTRTYLSVMFNAAPGPSAAGPSASPVSLLSEAHDARANWGRDFPGFTADASFSLNGREAKGTITVGADYQITYNLGDKELETAIRPSFASLIMHRRGGNPQYRATWRDGDTHPLGRAINLNDEHGSWYRVRDRQILQVNRTMGSQRFTNNVLENEETKLGFLPRAWTVAYYDGQKGDLLRTSTTRVTWTWIGEVFLPRTLETVNAHDEGTDVSRLVLTNHRLLK